VAGDVAIGAEFWRGDVGTNALPVLAFEGLAPLIGFVRTLAGTVVEEDEGCADGVCAICIVGWR
jgi:hypothetical protein